jgi:hypothetical protein
MNRLVTTANRPETEIDWPACPSVRCNPEAIGVSRLTGMNSDAISVETHRVSAKTAPQPPVRAAAASPAGAVVVVIALPSHVSEAGGRSGAGDADHRVGGLLDGGVGDVLDPDVVALVHDGGAHVH